MAESLPRALLIRLASRGRGDRRAAVSLWAVLRPFLSRTLDDVTYKLPDGTVVLTAESDQVCELCGAVEETRPYGPHGKRVCFNCAMKDEPEAKRQFDKLLNGEIQ